MANTFSLKVIACDRIFFDGRCTQVVLPLHDGEKAIHLFGNVPICSIPWQPAGFQLLSNRDQKPKDFSHRYLTKLYESRTSCGILVLSNPFTEERFQPI